MRQLLTFAYWLGLLAIGVAGRAGAQPVTPTAQWVSLRGTSGYDASFYAALDGAGNTYSAGYTDPGNYADTQLYLSKHDVRGQQLWQRQFICTNGSVTPVGIKADAAGNVWVNGFFGPKPNFSGAVTFVTFDGVTLTTSNPNNNDLFVLKLDPAGTVLWARQSSVPVGPGGNRYGSALAVDPGGNAYLLGEGKQGMRLGPGAPALSQGTSFVAKYSPQGAVQWIRELGHFSNQLGDLAADAAGNCYLVNFTLEPVTLGPAAFAGASGYLARLDPQGQVQWARPVPVSPDFGGGIRLAATPGGELRLTLLLTQPATLGSQTFVPQRYDLLCLGFTTQGAYQWGWQVGSPGSALATSLAVEPDGSSYLVMTTHGLQTLTQPSGDLYDTRYFLAALAPTGTLRWWRGFPTGVVPLGLAVAAPDDLRLAGLLDRATSLDGFTLPFLGVADAFTARLNLMPPGTTTTPTTTTPTTTTTPATTTPATPTAAPAVFLPNVITPDGDGLNDTFAPRNLPAGFWQLRVYSRWGRLVYQADDYRLNWSAEGLAGGLYYFRLEATGRPACQGWVEVVR